LPIVEANLAMRVAEGRLAGVPTALNFAGPLLFSRTPYDAENWASDFLMVGTELAQGRAEYAARRAAETLAMMDPGAPGPPPKPDPLAFVTFGVELQLGLALRAAHEMLEDSERARAALPWAATIFLRNQMEAAPTRLLHLEPNLREQTTETMKALITELDEFGHREYDWLRFLESGEPEGPYVNALVADELGTVESRYLQPSFALGAWDDAGWPRREVSAVAGSLIATLGPLRRAEARDERPESFS
jgi:hypothetical protein